MAEGNGATTGGGFSSKIQHAIGDLGRYFRNPNELSDIGTQSPQGQQQQGQQPKQQGQQGKQPSGASNDGATNDAETMQNPLDVYAGLFDNSPKLDKDGKPVAGPPEAPKFKLDSKVIKDAASKMDFTAGLAPELQEKLTNGQPLTSAEQLQLHNHIGANAYSHAMEHVTTLADKYIDMRLSHEQQGLRSEVNKLLAKSRTLSNPAIAKNPALKEHFEVITERLSTKFPDATPEWIAQQAESFFTDVAKAINPELGSTGKDNAEAIKLQKEGATVEGGKVFDWNAYLK